MSGQRGGSAAAGGHKNPVPPSCLRALDNGHSKRQRARKPSDSSKPDIKLLFNDDFMPDMNGRKLADEMKRRKPALPMLTRELVLAQGRCTNQHGNVARDLLVGLLS